MLNRIILIGNLCADPEGPRQAGSSQVTDFRIASTERWGPRDDQQRTLFIDVECWGRLAEVVGENLRKGRRVFVEGKLQVDEWGEGEQRRSKYKINAHNVQFLDRPSDSDDDGRSEQQHDQRDSRSGGGQQRGSHDGRTNGGGGQKSRLPDYGLDNNIPF